MSVCPVRGSEWNPQLGGGCPYVGPSTPHRSGPTLPVGPRRWPLCCSKGAQLGPLGSGKDQRGLQTAQQDPRTVCQAPVRSVPSGSSAVSTPNDVRVDRVGPEEGRKGAVGGGRGPVSGRLEPLCQPRTPLGAHHGPETMRWPYLGLRGSDRTSQGTSVGCSTPHLCGFHPSEWPPRWPRFGVSFAWVPEAWSSWGVERLPKTSIFSLVAVPMKAEWVQVSVILSTGVPRWDSVRQWLKCSAGSA